MVTRNSISRVLVVRQFLGNCNPTNNPCGRGRAPSSPPPPTIPPTCRRFFSSSGASGPSPPSNVRSRNLEYPDWKWNLFWSMHIPWEDGRLTRAVPQGAFLENVEYDLELKRVQDESLSAIFWFYDLREYKFLPMLSVIQRWAKLFPHVTLCECPIHAEDEEFYNSQLRERNLNCLPTFRFFQNGKKVDELAGDSVSRLEKTLEKIYGQRSAVQDLDSPAKIDNNGKGVDSSVEAAMLLHSIGEIDIKGSMVRLGSKCPCNCCSSSRMRIRSSIKNEKGVTRTGKKESQML